MPLSATFAGHRVVSTLLDEDAWRNLQAASRADRSRLLMRCGWPAVAKTSVLGTRFFAHTAGGDGCTQGESPEHLAGKAAIVEWVADAYPDLTVDTEVPIGDRERIADVLVTWPTGQRVAIEIQYARLSDHGDHDSWHDRTNDYLDHDILPIWLLGHTGAQLKVWEPADQSEDWPKQVRLNALHNYMTHQGAKVLWLNPFTRTVATPSTGRERPVPIRTATSSAHLHPEPLTDCALDPECGLTTPAMERLHGNAQEMQRLQAERQKVDAARRAEQWAAEERRKGDREARLATLKAQGEKTLAEAWRVARERRLDPEPQLPGQPRYTHCLARGCGSRLDPIYQPTGYHGMCEPPGFRLSTPPPPDPQQPLF